MDGDICPLPEILEVAKRHGARILIDEAHSTFLFGPNGRGVAEHFGVDKEVDFHLGTFSKSLGGQGGFVAGTQGAHRLRDRVRALALLLLQPLARADGGAARRACASRSPSRSCARSSGATCAFLRRRFAEEGVDIGKSNSQVMPVMVNNDSRVLQVAEKIQERGPVPEPRHLPGGAEAQVAPAHLRLRGPHRGRARAGGADDRRRPARGGDLPGITRYGYRDAISGFFEFPTENARRVLPRGFEPVEVHHGSSILAMTVFDFNESEVGEYGEVVYAVIVPPLVRDTRLPKSAFFPWQVATTTKAAREHAIERWHLPHWMDDVKVDFEPREGRRPRPRSRPTARRHSSSASPTTPGSRSRTSTSRSRRTTRAPTSRTSCSRARRASTRRRRARSCSTSNAFNKDIADLRGLRDAVPRAVDEEGLPALRPARADRGEVAGRSRSSSSSTRTRARGGAPSSSSRCSSTWRPRRSSSTALTQAPGDEARLATEAIARGFRRIVAVGGDGTWSNVGNAILQDAACPRSLGLVPGGTGCDLAKTLGIPPRDVAACCRDRAGRPPRAIDVGKVEDRHFLNIAGFGYDVAVLEDSWNVSYLEGSALYLYCALRQLGSFGGFTVAVEADGRPVRRARDADADRGQRARLRRAASRSPRSADPADGKLDVVAFGNMGLGGRVERDGAPPARNPPRPPEGRDLRRPRGSCAASTSRRPTRPTASGTARAPRSS